ncbi:MAG: YchJ family metal-binding protein [Burkholderiaceae bacterium]
MNNIAFKGSAKSASQRPCPCRARDGAPLPYAQCCQPWHSALSQGGFAPAAEQLMRARYSAYALATHNNPQGHAMLDFLHATWHHSSAPGDLELSPIQWVGLDVVHAEQTATAAVVEFVAHYKEGGKAQRMHEISRFIFEAGSGWQYIDGERVPD